MTQTLDILPRTSLKDDLALLQRLGEMLEQKTAPALVKAGSRRISRGVRTRVSTPHKRAWDETVRDFLIRTLLKVRNKNRGLVPLIPNRAQREFAARCTHRNIVLKARQMGITTYVAARFFVQTITRPGTMTVQVAHDQESAEEISRSSIASGRTCPRR